MTYETEKSTFTSTYQTADDDDNLSIRYRNLYSINGEITYLSLDKNDSPPYVHKWTNSHDWRPKIKHFESESELKNFVNQFSDIEEVELALLNDNLWYGNIGHALFDGLYPVFLAAVKFGLEDSDFVYLADNWSNPKVLANEAIINFCGCDIRSYQNLDKDKVILFKNLVSGTGRTGNRVMNETYKLYGNQYHGLEKFKFRMLSRNGATADKPINSKFKIAIINNKRYSSKERLEIKKIIDRSTLEAYLQTSRFQHPKTQII